MPNPIRTYQFEGFEIPTTTQTPDIIFDLILPDLSGAELKVLLYIVRHTYGFKNKRDGDTISLSQLMHGITTKDGHIQDRGTGLSKKTLLKAIDGLEAMALIEKERRQSADRGYEPTLYRLKMKKRSDAHDSQEGNPNDEQDARPMSDAKGTHPLGEKVHQGGGGESTPSPWGNNSPIQQTRKQQTVTLSNSKESKTKRDDDAVALSPDVSPHTPIHARQESAPPRVVSNSFPSQPTRGLAKLGTLLGQRTGPADNGASDVPPGASQMPKNRPGRGVAASGTDRGGETLVDIDLVASASSRERSAPAARGRHPKIEQMIALASQELLDTRHLRANVTQGLNVFARCGLDESTFLDVAAQALALTRESARAGTIRGARMAYYFSVLRERTALLGRGERRRAHQPSPLA